MSIWYKQGVFGELQPNAAEGLRRTERLYTLKGKQVYVTSIRDGTHGTGSLHITGMAFDMRAEGVSIDDHKKALGPEYDVVDESNHRHVEYDPK